MTAAGAWLASVRETPRTRWLAFALATLLGIALASIHWIGFFFGGAFVGLLSRNLKRAVLAGAVFGLLAWVAFALWLAWQGTLSTYLGTGQLLAVSVAIPVVAGIVGSLARGLV